jgi:hypothetical protein
MCIFFREVPPNQQLPAKKQQGAKSAQADEMSRIMLSPAHPVLNTGQKRHEKAECEKRTWLAAV